MTCVCSSVVLYIRTFYRCFFVFIKIVSRKVCWKMKLDFVFESFTNSSFFQKDWNVWMKFPLKTYLTFEFIFKCSTIHPKSVQVWWYWIRIIKPSNRKNTWFISLQLNRWKTAKETAFFSSNRKYMRSDYRLLHEKAPIHHRSKENLIEWIYKLDELGETANIKVTGITNELLWIIYLQ